MTGIYKITNTANGKVYIGQAMDIEKRWREHKKVSKAENNVLYRAIRKYGIKSFIFEIIEECQKEELNEKEIYYIEQYKSYIHAENSNGYNMTLGGEGVKGYIHSEEIKQKISDSLKGDKNPMYGKARTEETKRRMSESLKGKTHTEETKRKMSESSMGKKNPKSKGVICERVEYESVNQCAKHYNIVQSTMTRWLNGVSRMPQEFVIKGLCYLEEL